MEKLKLQLLNFFFQFLEKMKAMDQFDNSVVDLEKALFERDASGGLDAAGFHQPVAAIGRFDKSIADDHAARVDAEAPFSQQHNQTAARELGVQDGCTIHMGGRLRACPQPTSRAARGTTEFCSELFVLQN